MQKWLFPDMLDQHGYVTPTLIEATTKPHNPGIDYDLFLKWNQPRTAANERRARDASGSAVQRPVNDWCANADLPPIGSTVCADGNPPGPAVAEGWDDWGPFYTPMYNQLVGLNGSTVEMCSARPRTRDAAGLRRARADELPAWPSGGPHGAVRRHDVDARVTTSPTARDCCGHARDLPPRRRRRGAAGVLPGAVRRREQLDARVPEAYVIPLGDGQRSDAEANRLVQWLLTTASRSTQLELGRRHSAGSGSSRAPTWSGWTSRTAAWPRPRSASASTSPPAIGQLYAPPAAWSHGYLWGADVVQVPRGRAASRRGRARGSAARSSCTAA